MKILVSVVVFSEIQQTKKFLEYNKSLLNSENIELVFIDNFSKYLNNDKIKIKNELNDYDFDFINNNKKFVVNKNNNLHYIFNDSNEGYAKANNKVYNMFNGEKYDYFLILNNDIYIKKINDVYSLIDILNKRKLIGAIGPKIQKDNQIQGPYRYHSINQRYISLIIFPYYRIFNNKIITDQIFDAKEGKVYRIMGCFMLFKSNVFKDINGFDEKTFLYAEESILSEKMKKINKDFYYYPHITVYHDHSQTISKYLNLKNRLKNRFKSDLYYYKTYKKVNFLQIIFSKIALNSYLYVYLPIINLIKKLKKD
jgi:GT2 family glycosyltransferase